MPSPGRASISLRGNEKVGKKSVKLVCLAMDHRVLLFEKFESYQIILKMAENLKSNNIPTLSGREKFPCGQKKVKIPKTC